MAKFDEGSWDENAELGKSLYGAKDAQGYSPPGSEAKGCLLGISLVGALILVGVIIWWMWSR